MKSTIILATALFLVSAPSPDSKSISEMSAGFLIETNVTGLMAAEPGPAKDNPMNPYERSLTADLVAGDSTRPSVGPVNESLAR